MPSSATTPGRRHRDASTAGDRAVTTAVVESLCRAAADLDAAGIGWALVGGMAVSARSEPRFTRDVDVCVVVRQDAEAEAAVRSLLDVGYVTTSVVEHRYLDRLSTVRLVSPVPGGVLVDLLFASSGIEPEIVAAAERIEILPGLTVPVARVAHLVVLKLLARDDADRPQDAADLIALRPRLAVDDEGEVRRLCALVVDRGFGRERDLVALADAYLRGPGQPGDP